jgi:hypothetical protein
MWLNISSRAWSNDDGEVAVGVRRVFFLFMHRPFL